MRAILIVSANTIRKGLRKKFLAILLLSCFLVLCLSLLFAQLSLDDKGRLTVDFGLATVQLLLVSLSVFFGAGFISSDMDKKLWMILTRPIRPSVFFLGRYFGLTGLLFLGWLSLSLLLVLFFVFLKIPIQLILLYALLGFLVESLFLLAFVLFFASYSQSFLVSFYCLSIFIIGHFLETLFYFIEKMPGGLSLILSQILSFLPNLERINWKSAVVYQDQIAFSDWALSSVPIILWTGLILSWGLLIMENREYG